MPDTHRFTLPQLPASMNAIYQIIFGLRKVEMKPEVRYWRNQMKDYIPPWEPVEERKLWMNLAFFDNWNTNAGKVRVIDLPNMVKVTVDVIAEKLKFNDCLIFSMKIDKVQSESLEQIQVEMGVL